MTPTLSIAAEKAGPILGPPPSVRALAPGAEPTATVPSPFLTKGPPAVRERLAQGHSAAWQLDYVGNAQQPGLTDYTVEDDAVPAVAVIDGAASAAGERFYSESEKYPAASSRPHALDVSPNVTPLVDVPDCSKMVPKEPSLSLVGRAGRLGVTSDPVVSDQNDIPALRSDMPKNPKDTLTVDVCTEAVEPDGGIVEWLSTDDLLASGNDQEQDNSRQLGASGESEEGSPNSGRWIPSVSVPPLVWERDGNTPTLGQEAVSASMSLEALLPVDQAVTASVDSTWFGLTLLRGGIWSGGLLLLLFVSLPEVTQNGLLVSPFSLLMALDTELLVALAGVASLLWALFQPGTMLVYAIVILVVAGIVSLVGGAPPPSQSGLLSLLLVSGMSWRTSNQASALARLVTFGLIVLLAASFVSGSDWTVMQAAWSDPSRLGAAVFQSSLSALLVLAGIALLFGKVSKHAGIVLTILSAWLVAVGASLSGFFEVMPSVVLWRDGVSVVRSSSLPMVGLVLLPIGIGGLAAHFEREITTHTNGSR
ncbi:MAG: hypothetical protein VX223_09070 [Myxococcota bacterium]|nr:hypothetical protein [Myxococcota bacterium]